MKELVSETAFNSVPSYYDFGHKICKGLIDEPNKGFADLMNYPDNFKFDLVAHDFVVGPCLLGFLSKFKYPPLIGMTAFNNPPFTVDIVSGHKYPGYMPYYHNSFDMEMTLMERINNAIVHYWDQ